MANKDATNKNKHTGNEWVKRTEDRINKVHKVVGYGKALEEMIDEAEKVGGKLGPHEYILPRDGLHTPKGFTTASMKIIHIFMKR